MSGPYLSEKRIFQKAFGDSRINKHTESSRRRSIAVYQDGTVIAVPNLQQLFGVFNRIMTYETDTHTV